VDSTAPIPRERTTPLKATTGERIAAAAIAAFSLFVLTTAAWLTPNPGGHATHTQLGMPQCTWVIAFDKPCPTCGMTTAFSHAGEGSWITATLTQPMGALLAFFTTMIFWASTHQAVTASRIGSVVQTALRPKLVIAMLVLTAGAWIYKIATWT
jgi:Protein of unknown function (DUF2752)